MTKAVLNVLHLLPGCEKTINPPVEALEGVGKDNVQIFYKEDELHVTFNEQLTSIEEIKTIIESYGYPVVNTRSATKV